jgi:SAM-dependent methyltransferase
MNSIILRTVSFISIIGYKILILLKELKDFFLKERSVFPKNKNQAFSAKQLEFLVEKSEKCSKTKGIFLEIGCAIGNTTLFINKKLKEKGIVREYLGVDTFSGFVYEDAVHEINHRNKTIFLLRNFKLQRQKWFDKKMLKNNLENVSSVKSDIKKFDFNSIGKIAFCLLDIDLYKPIKFVLPLLYERLSPGGTIIVDDVKPNMKWDGAYQAYKEFTKEKNLPFIVQHGKLGIIEK